VDTFGHAVRLGARPPMTTEEAQYAIGFPVAALLARGELGAAEISGDGLRCDDVRSMLARLTLSENNEFSSRFPAERIAIVTIERDDGTTFISEPMAARGDPESPLTDMEIVGKFRQLAGALDAERRARIEGAISALENDANASDTLRSCILKPP
jgi:2-methylcitrate dehydratase PrpD